MTENKNMKNKAAEKSAKAKPSPTADAKVGWSQEYERI